MVKEIDTRVQEAQRVLILLDLKRTTPRHIIIKMLKVKIKGEPLFKKRFYLFIFRQEGKGGRR